jgi:hypothetical protein
MQKRTIIRKINRIIEKYGAFAIGEVDGFEDGIIINSMGDLVALAEYFGEDKLSTCVYAPNGSSSDSISNYEVNYQDLSKELLEEILTLAEAYETDQEKTLKRISN